MKRRVKKKKTKRNEVVYAFYFASVFNSDDRSWAAWSSDLGDED